MAGFSRFTKDGADAQATAPKGALQAFLAKAQSSAPGKARVAKTETISEGQCGHDRNSVRD